MLCIDEYKNSGLHVRLVSGQFRGTYVVYVKLDMQNHVMFAQSRGFY